MSKSDKKRKGADYQVGRGKPPRQAQWPKGVSGNPSGKKRGTLDLKTVCEKTLLQPLTSPTSGETITVLEALIKKLAQSGLKGDTKATNSLLDRVERLGGFEQAREVETSEEDREILRRVLGRRSPNGEANHQQTSDAAEMEDDIETTPNDAEDEHA